MEVVGASVEEVVEASMERVDISRVVGRFHEGLKSPITYYMDSKIFRRTNGGIFHGRSGGSCHEKG